MVDLFRDYDSMQRRAEAAEAELAAARAENERLRAGIARMHTLVADEAMRREGKLVDDTWLGVAWAADLIRDETRALLDGASS